ncbi:hypothetical protein ABZS61_32010 [Streptomyces sp. NPDC005566]
MAKELGLSQSTVLRNRRAFGLQSPCPETFRLSTNLYRRHAPRDCRNAQP